MNRERVDNLTNDLATVLDRMIAMHELQLGILQRKLDAMRTSDPEQITQICGEESDIAGALVELNTKRYRVVADICEALGMERPDKPERITLRSLVQALPSGLQQRLLALGEELRLNMLKVAEINRTVELVCREMLTHFKVLFSAFATGDGNDMYSDTGSRRTGAGVGVLDAVV